MTLDERCKLATDCLPDAEYRRRLEALHAELLALRKDAERYRWLRDSAVAEIYLPTIKNASGWAVLLGWQSATERDAAIDAAMAKP